MLKIYTLIHDFSLSTPVNAGGVPVEVVFRGGCKALNQNGEYGTTDPLMQQALEAAPGFNRTYRLSKSFPLAGESPAADTPVPEAAPVLEGKNCATVNEAMAWLVSLGCRRCDVETSAKAVAAARTLGYELTFTKKR